LLDTVIVPNFILL